MNFGEVVKFTMDREGGYVNDPADAGGETNFGISKRSYPNVDIKKLTRAQAQGIYHKDYWTACGCGSLESGMDAAVFDTAVNCGVKRALSWLRNSTTVRDYLEHRRAYYLSLNNKRFINGWLNRVNELSKFIDMGK